MKNPSFIIIGAAKSGTSSIADYLGQHPEVYFSTMKESRWLAYRETLPKYKGYGRQGQKIMDSYRESIPKSKEEYMRMFAGASKSQATGEASPCYLYLPSAPKAIRDLIPTTRLVVILRNPVDRAYSSFLHMRREDAEIESFEEALSMEQERIIEGAGLPYHYMSMGYYGKQINMYYNYFNKDQIKILFYDELALFPEKFMADLCNHIEVDSSFRFDLTKISNVSGIPKNRSLFELLSRQPNKFTRRITSFVPKELRIRARGKIIQKLLEKPKIETATRQRLENGFREDLMLLEDLINRKHPWHKR